MSEARETTAVPLTQPVEEAVTPAKTDAAPRTPWLQRQTAKLEVFLKHAVWLHMWARIFGGNGGLWP